MTVYNWSSMSPRERDALVAEKVIALKPDSKREYKSDGKGGYRWYVIPGWNVNGKYRRTIPHYTTDISAAWEVVDKFQYDDFIVQHCVDETWYATVYSDNVGRSDYCKSAPEAICKAALRAADVDIQ